MKCFSPRVWVIALAAIGLALTAQPVQAAYTFTKLETNTTYDGSGLLMTVNAGVDAHQAVFRFYNNGPGVITAIYFDDGTLLGSVLGFGSSNGIVDFNAGGNGNLPGGQSVNFVTTSDFVAHADSPPPEDGIGTGEWLEITFSLINNQTVQDVIDDLEWGLDHPGDSSGGLRVGLHVQAIPNSDSFLNGETDGGGSGGLNSVPAPAGLILLASAVPVLAFRRFVRRKQAA